MKMRALFRSLAVAMFVAVFVALSSACEHPLGVFTPHIEAADLVLADSGGVEITRTDFNRRWLVDSLVMRVDQPLRVVLTPIDFRGEAIDINARRDLSYRMEAEDGALIQWEPQRGFGWLRPFATGSTRVRFLIWHDTHADFITPWLRVVVHPAESLITHIEE